MAELNYQQQSGQGCLSVCLAYLCGLEPDEAYERYMMKHGLFGFRDNFAISMLMAFESYGAQRYALSVSFGNKEYASQLQRQFSNQHVSIDYASMSELLVRPASRPYILYVDNHALGSYYHYPHFVLVLASSAKMMTIFDPWDGAQRRISRTKIIHAVDMLRDHLRICPVAIFSHESPNVM